MFLEVSKKQYPLPELQIRHWQQTKMFFPLPLRAETRAVVLHWTGGTGNPARVFQTLQSRKLSVQFCVSAEGQVWQYCDATARAQHASGANAWAVGIELCSPAYAPIAPIGREHVTDTIHGRAVKYLTFTQAQIDATRVLVRVLCELYDLPYQAPAETTVLSAEELATVQGVLGHFHVSPRKNDPGVDVFRKLGLYS